jgi:chromosome segregation ATPase
LGRANLFQGFFAQNIRIVLTGFGKCDELVGNRFFDVIVAVSGPESDRELESLRRELATLRDEVELKLNLKNELATARSELAAARAEIAELRERAPSFDGKLAALRETVEKQAKTILRLRGEQSTLEFGQRKLETERQKDRREATLTETKLTAFGEQTSR